MFGQIIVTVCKCADHITRPLTAETRQKKCESWSTVNERFYLSSLRHMQYSLIPVHCGKITNIVKENYVYGFPNEKFESCCGWGFKVTCKLHVLALAPY